MPTLIVLSGGEKVIVVESPEQVAGQLQSTVPTRLNRTGDDQTGVWINPAAVVCFYEATEPFAGVARS